MFVDASAMVALLTADRERDALLQCLDEADAPITSALAIFETVVAVARKKRLNPAEAEVQVREFLSTAGIAIVPLDARESVEAIAAFSRYGKGRGHPAQLNLGDCFAYACAQAHDVPLLFVGDDFTRTDIRAALA